MNKETNTVLDGAYCALNEAMIEMYEVKKPTKGEWMMEAQKAIKLSFDAVCDMAMMGATIGSCCEIMLNGVFVGEPIDLVNPEHNGGREVYEIDQETGVPTGRSIYVAYSDTYDVPHVPHRHHCDLEINNNTAPDNNPVHEAIEFYWGKRCEDYEETCCVCEAWKQFDDNFKENEE